MIPKDKDKWVNIFSGTGSPCAKWHRLFIFCSTGLDFTGITFYMLTFTFCIFILASINYKYATSLSCQRWTRDTLHCIMSRIQNVTDARCHKLAMVVRQQLLTGGIGNTPPENQQKNFWCPHNFMTKDYWSLNVCIWVGWVQVLYPTRHKICHFRHSYQPNLWLVLG